MTQFSHSAGSVFTGPGFKVTLPAHFGLKWILGNALGYAIGIGWPFLLSDPSSVDDLAGAGAIAFLSFGVSTGLIQWIVLRQAIPISPLWIVATYTAPAISMLSIAVSSAPSATFFLIVILYSLSVSLMQWVILRRQLRPAWEWIIASLVAITLGFATSLFLSRILERAIDLPLHSLVVIGALAYGYVYGTITYIGLRQLCKPDRMLASPSIKADKAHSSPKTSWKMMLLSSGLLCALAAIWFAVLPPLSGRAIERIFNASPLWVFGLGLVSVFGYSYLMILVHELGHLVLALAYGFDLRAFAVGRWIFIRHSKKWKFCRARTKFAGGFVLPVPKSLNTFNKRSLMMMIAGGSITTFLLFAVGVLPVFLMPAAVSNSLFLWFTAVLSIISLHSFCLNILPLTIGHLRTDGRRFLDLTKDNVPGQSFFALYSVDASLRQGIRPRDIDSALIEQVLSAPATSMIRADGLYTAYTAAMDNGQIEQASEYLDQTLNSQCHIPELFRGKSFLEGAYFEALIRGRSDVARQWFEKIPDTTFIPPAALLRVEAALLWSEGNSEAALKKAEAGMVSVGRDRFMKGTAVAEEDLLKNLIQQISES